MQEQRGTSPVEEASIRDRVSWADIGGGPNPSEEELLCANELLQIVPIKSYK